MPNIKKMDNYINQIREQFPALNQTVNGKSLIYLDNGATAQKPFSVIEKMNLMNSGVNGNIHRAVHELSAKTTDLYEGSRVLIQKFINARFREEIILTPGTTFGLNLIANSFVKAFLKAGDKILVSHAEHHSNIVPWQLVCDQYGTKLEVIPILETGEIDLEKFENLFKDNNIKIVSIAHISNVLGLINPIKEIIKIAHSKGAVVIVDGAQGIVHQKVDVVDLDCDFYVFSGHKMYGPTGTGVLYGKKEYLEIMPPWLGGGDMVGSVSFEKTTYAELPLKFEAGTPNFISSSALGDAVEFMQTLNIDKIHENEHKIVVYLLNEMAAIPGLKLYGNEERLKTPIFSFNVDGVHHTDIAMLLDKMGIAVRSGMMCAEPLMSRFNVTGMVRASFAAYNTIEEAELFIIGLKKAIKLLK